MATRADIYGAAFWLGLHISQIISFYETHEALWVFRGLHLLLAVTAMVFLILPFGPIFSRKEKSNDPS